MAENHDRNSSHARKSVTKPLKIHTEMDKGYWCSDSLTKILPMANLQDYSCGTAPDFHRVSQHAIINTLTLVKCNQF
jgi:hypothetical protein